MAAISSVPESRLRVANASPILTVIISCHGWAVMSGSTSIGVRDYELLICAGFEFRSWRRSGIGTAGSG